MQRKWVLPGQDPLTVVPQAAINFTLDTARDAGLNVVRCAVLRRHFRLYPASPGPSRASRRHHAMPAATAIAYEQSSDCT